MTRPSEIPIAVMAFNRPDYLRKVLESLTQQEDANLSERPIALFQDGGTSEYSGIEYARSADIQQNINVFKEFFPNARIERSSYNLGVAFNFDRAEKWVFDEIGSGAGIFLEDDMVLAPFYISMIDKMLEMAINDPRIGYVGAYGDWTLPLSKQQQAPGRLRMLTQNWAFGLTRTQWLKNRPFVTEYLSLIAGVDYRHRPHRRIFDLYSKYGMERTESSQDRAKFIACCLTGGVRVNTTACLARYIGRVGLHVTEELFSASGFDKTEVYPFGNFEIEALSNGRYQELLAEQRRHVSAISPQLQFGALLSFASGEIGAKGLRQGFYGPENWGAWSGDRMSVVELRLPSEVHDLGGLLWVDARYNLPAETPEVEVKVNANGREIGIIQVGRQQRRAVMQINPRLCTDDGRILLSFYSSVIGSPRDYGLGEDVRPLTLGLSKIGLSPNP